MFESIIFTNVQTLGIQVLLVVGAYCVWKLMVDAWGTWRIGTYVDKLPGWKAHWFFGSYYDFPGPNEEGFAYLRQKAAQYPRLYKLWFSPFLPVAVVHHPDTVKVILKTTEPKPGHFSYKFLRQWLGNGLILSNGAKWHRNRRLLTPAFHFDILKSYVNVYNEATDTFLSKMSRAATDNEYFEVFDSVTLLTLDILLQCAFSHRSNCQIVGDSHPSVTAVKQLSKAIAERALTAWLHSDLIYYLTPSGRKFKKNCTFVRSFAHKLIQSRKNALDKSDRVLRKTGKYLDFLDILLTARDDENRGLTDEEIEDEVGNFLFAGHDTTASAISWTLYSLATHPEHQTRCQREIDNILHGRTEDEITWEDLSRFTYLTMCIKEAMRLHTQVTAIMRQLTQDMEIDGYVIKEGTIVLVMLYMLHHNPTLWDNSTKFKPERFSTENLQKMDNFAFIPFSAGSRNCIGQQFALHELKLVIARTLYRFSLEVDPPHIERHCMDVVTTPEKGIRVKAKPRNVVS